MRAPSQIMLLATALLLIAATAPQKLKSNLPEGHFTADLLIVKENTPVATLHKFAAASRKDHDQGRLRTLFRGHEYEFPVIVQDYERPAGGMIEFTADYRMILPNGKTRTNPRFGKFVLQDSRKSRIPFIEIGPTLTVGFELTDPPGRYIMQAIVTDRVKNEARSLEESFELKP